MFKNVKILSWLVIILLATNLATIGTIFYHTSVSSHETSIENSELPMERRSRFFRDQLGLTPGQMESFRGFNQQFNRRSAQLSGELQQIREEILNELTSENTDTVRLNQLSAELGEKHKELKAETNKLYMELKELSDSTQKERLAFVFQSLLEGDNNFNMQRGRGMGRQMNRQ